MPAMMPTTSPVLSGSTGGGVKGVGGGGGGREGGIAGGGGEGGGGEGGGSEGGGGEGKKRRKRLPGTHPGTFYTSEALALWRRMMEERVFLTHDAYLKYAEVAKTQFTRFSNILLDESQDLTECQVQVFVVNQPHADVYIVGDAVQSLYSWRGARPKQLRTLSQRVGAQRAIKEDLQLTHSHRFGAGIARIANHITFIKTHSAQHNLWHHYSVVGAGPPTLQLLGEGMGLGEGPGLRLSQKRTVVGRTNAGLMIEAFELLSENANTRIGLLGKSSYHRFESICKEVLELLPHAENDDKPFKFKGGSYDNWEDFEQEVEDREVCSSLSTPPPLDCLPLLAPPEGRSAHPKLATRHHRCPMSRTCV